MASLTVQKLKKKIHLSVFLKLLDQYDIVYFFNPSTMRKSRRKPLLIYSLPGMSENQIRSISTCVCPGGLSDRWPVGGANASCSRRRIYTTECHAIPCICWTISASNCIATSVGSPHFPHWKRSYCCHVNITPLFYLWSLHPAHRLLKEKCFLAESSVSSMSTLALTVSVLRYASHFLDVLSNRHESDSNLLICWSQWKWISIAPLLSVTLKE